MIQTCLNHRQMTYDWCRNCNAKDLDCPEYLSSLEDSRLTQGRVVEACEDEISMGQNPKPRSNYEKPFYFGHSDLMRETRLPKIDERIFMRRFREAQR